MRSLGIVLAVALVVGVAASANADLIAYWNFNNQTNLGGTSGLWQQNPFGTTGAEAEYLRDSGTGTAEISAWGAMDASEGSLLGPNGTSGSASNQFGSFSGTTLNALNADISGGSLSIVGNGNNGHYFLIEIDDALSSASLSYATRGTATGYSTHYLEYSTNGGTTWTLLQSHAANQVSTWLLHTVQLNNIFASTSGHERNLIRFTVDGALSNNGNNRFDNMQINGMIVPEPATLVLVAIGGLALIRRKLGKLGTVTNGV
jgi:hypothetical protein